MSLTCFGPIKSHPEFDQPKAYVEHLTTQSRSSFTLGMKILSKPRREAMFAIYAFCRVVDDIADEPGEKKEKTQLLMEWREEIERLYKGNPHSLIGQALADPIVDFDIPKQEFLLMIEGMETDVNGPVCAPTLDELLAYTRRVAGTVGMMSIRVFGVKTGDARDRFALNLADALQLTNILRDIEEDVDIGRLYLPSDILEANDINSNDPHIVAAHPNLRNVCRDMGKIARARFTESRRILETLNGQPVRPALMMMGVYEGYLDKMEAADFVRDPALSSMSKWQKLGRCLQYAFAFPKRSLPIRDTTIPPLAEIDHR